MDQTTGPALYQLFPELEATLPYRRLGSGPTPITHLEGLGPANRLWCKDEGVYGAGGWGGNKVRKLEWIIPDVLARGSRQIFSVGGQGTNWGLATALYAHEFGIDTALALIDQPMDEHVHAQLERLRHSGAALHFTRTKARTIAAAPWLLLRHARGGRLPYFLPAGGSSPLGTLGYVEAALELGAQVEAGAMPEPTHVVTPVGSGGTAAGLLLGLRLAGLRTRVVGVVVNDTLPLAERDLVGLARKTARLLTRRGAALGPVEFEPGAITVTRDWLGPGYGFATPEGSAAERIGADHGLTLDPVYTAKALAGALAMDADGALGDGPVLVVDTYGPRGD
ncbi:pyridoxal-phosphate dependent enzyme [Rhodococcus maanshanensis]|uniref:1-aminocyclopropane-1-carboxylate deaminase/D-cysteine desulfhydrase n=1 Tax=Rhodococcus maanshanensis TaxID=183556 RepID=UPI0022B4C6B1|nr:pyridoxal-phosphate dependent enzyme [Rhodococcus maanshanensis]MCZ4556387.1 pyridoxal-phosphate dependent enzyme [Rhodococcus maanshanensis]